MIASYCLRLGSRADITALTIAAPGREKPQKTSDAMGAQLNIHVEQVYEPTGEVRALVEELECELAANYPASQRHGLALGALFQPHIRFFIARLDGEAVGCGGVALFANWAELKRMYVRPHARGRSQGIAELILTRLATEATNAGLKLLRLETGTRQEAAIRFYQRCGFTRCEAFEPYSSMPAQAISTSVFMEKRTRMA